MPALNTRVTPNLEVNAVMPQRDAMNDQLSGIRRPSPTPRKRPITPVVVITRLEHDFVRRSASIP